MPPGRNNQVFELRSDRGRFLVKHYFTHPLDPRDRLQAEFAFSSFVWSAGLTQAPRPIASLPEQRLAVYELIQGEALTRADDPACEQALDFLIELNRCRTRPLASSLPQAGVIVADDQLHAPQAPLLQP